MGAFAERSFSSTIVVLATALSGGAFAQSDSAPDAARATSPTEETAPFQGGPQLDATIGAGEAQGDVVGPTADARAKVEAELERLQRENRRLYRAALKYVEVEAEYNEARKSLGE